MPLEYLQCPESMEIFELVGIKRFNTYLILESCFNKNKLEKHPTAQDCPNKG